MDIKVKAAGLSVASNIALTAGKLVVGSIIGSVSVISEAIHSANDLLASFIALWAVRKSAQPPDQEHPYGHGKVENIAGTIEAVLIFIAAVFIISESIEKIRQGGEILEPGWGMLVMAVSAGLNFMVSSYLLKVGKEQDSVALEADGVHLRTDVYTSLGVMAGLGLIQLSGYWILDPIIAILVALLIVKAAFDLLQKAFLPLLDTAADAETMDTVTEVLEDLKGEFIEYHDLRSRKAGRDVHIDMHLVVQAQMSIEEAHDLCDTIESRIQERLNYSHVLIHVEPE
ncbi:MAG: cation diffusion facilitator family transporter [Syntrophomonadaceae bacterium]|jgi:cation diffusion facilitator family transporter|nr:cation transporter [Syntrophomonadaceae bacterium]